MAASNGSAGKDVGIDDLMSAVADVSAEVKELSSRVDRLLSAVRKLDVSGAVATASPPARRAARSGAAGASSRPEVKRIAVVVAPLPELAMAAMAETSLRDLPGVQEVLASERVEDSARFTLEAVDGTDVIAEMRNVMPVDFTVIDPGPEEISVRLHWAWGTPD